ncbi:MAG: histidine phosphatase family protein [Candidatus Dormibacteraeota bacterium]|nr:histidine phosphatase family protein [Candidatus Dormibacteraeota bacterium]
METGITALIRHAKAGERGTHHDQLRALTEGGQRQAERLVGQLAAVRIGRVLTSPYVRCRQTVEPLASARGLKVEDSEPLAEGGSGVVVLGLMAELAGAGAALCSHGDVIGTVLQELVRRGLLDLSELRASKGSTWLVEFNGSEPRRATYLAAPESNP